MPSIQLSTLQYPLSIISEEDYIGDSLNIINSNFLNTAYTLSALTRILRWFSYYLPPRATRVLGSFYRISAYPTHDDDVLTLKYFKQTSYSYWTLIKDSQAQLSALYSPLPIHTREQYFIPSWEIEENTNSPAYVHPNEVVTRQYLESYIRALSVITITGQVSGSNEALSSLSGFVSGLVLSASVSGTGVVNAGLGLRGGGPIHQHPTIHLGDPLTITNTSVNAIYAQSHSHAIEITKDKVGLSNVDNVKQLPLSGGQMTGFLTLYSDPISNFHAVTKQYVDRIIGARAFCVFHSSSLNIQRHYNIATIERQLPDYSYIITFLTPILYPIVHLQSEDLGIGVNLAPYQLYFQYINSTTIRVYKSDGTNSRALVPPAVDREGYINVLIF